MRRPDLGTTIARAQQAQARPRTLDDVTLSARQLDRRELEEHTRLTPWRDVEPDEVDRALERKRDRRILRIRTCDARHVETGKREAVWVYEWAPESEGRDA